MTSPHLTSLPTELLDLILSKLDTKSLRQLNCVSSWAYNITLPLLWQTLDLVDRPGSTPITKEGDYDIIDTHDDSGIIYKLIIVAR